MKNIGAAFNLLMRTLPIVGVRLGVMLLFWVAALIYLAITGGIALLIGQAVDWLGFIIFIIAVAGIAPLYNLAYRYVFYMIKAAHIAVMAELLKNNSLPEGTGQLAWGKQKVQERFGEMNVMFVVDEMVNAVVRAFTRTVYNIATWLPGDTAEQIVSIVNRVIMYATNYIDEAILARSFWVESENPWANARDGVVLYAMVWKRMLMPAIWLMVLSLATALGAFLILAAPVGLIVGVINAKLAGWAIIFALVLGWFIKAAVGDALAVAAILITYKEETEGLTPDPEMAQKLDNVSDKFRELTARARDAVGFGNKSAEQEPPQAPLPGESPTA